MSDTQSLIRFFHSFKIKVKFNKEEISYPRKKDTIQEKTEGHSQVDTEGSSYSKLEKEDKGIFLNHVITKSFD